mmetsp:Transcript_5305/g.9300  ORF Transcript_5305/g.9300 Transcript_5305/m.9300 type:complete len:252 (-) Transcript_5305:14-769(-)
MIAENNWLGTPPYAATTRVPPGVTTKSYTSGLTSVPKTNKLAALFGCLTLTVVNSRFTSRKNGKAKKPIVSSEIALRRGGVGISSSGEISENFREAVTSPVSRLNTWIIGSAASETPCGGTAALPRNKTAPKLSIVTSELSNAGSSPLSKLIRQRSIFKFGLIRITNTRLISESLPDTRKSPSSNRSKSAPLKIACTPPKTKATSKETTINFKLPNLIPLLRVKSPIVSPSYTKTFQPGFLQIIINNSRSF